MNNYLFDQINQKLIKLQSQLKIIGVGFFLVVCGLIYYLTISDQINLILMVTLISVVLLFLVILLISMIKTHKEVKIFTKEILLPELIRQINSDLLVQNKLFIKDEALDSYFIHKSGSFKSTNIIADSKQSEFAFVSNYISNGQSPQEIFSGTYLSLKLANHYDDMVQIRIKGKPNKNKQNYLTIKKITNDWTEQINQYEQLSFFASNEQKFTELVTNDMVSLFKELNDLLPKGKIIMTIYKNKCIIGVHDRYNYNSHALFKQFSEQSLKGKVNHLTMINTIINKTKAYINKNEL